MKKRFRLLVLSVLCAVFAHAQYAAPSEGVFRIVNVAYNAALMEDFTNNKLYCTAIGDNDDYEQLWVLKKSSNGYSLQNAFTGAYIQTGNSGNEVNYWTGPAAKTFNIMVAAGGTSYNIWDTGLDTGQGLHSKGANGNVVRWSACDASAWKFEKVSVSDGDLAAARAEYQKFLHVGDNLDAYQAVLRTVFEDEACTKLAEAYAAMSAEGIKTALADKLPATLVDMAVKVKTGEWYEDNEKANKPGWDSDYAKKFRVQMIEPHSIAGEITEWIGHQGHTNMDNPIGVYANRCEALYIMVEGEIKEGAELYACWINGHSKMESYNNGYPNGVQLKPGLNIVPLSKNGSALYINYLVHTFDKATWKFAHKLSNFDDIKVHVEGGYINGYYNVEGDALYTPDNDDDWVYYEERANLENITILGRYEVLQFELNDVPYVDDKGNQIQEGLAKLFPEKLPTNMPNSPAFTAPNQRINGIVEAWDRIFLSEKMTLGVASRAEVDSMNKLFPRWDATWTKKAEIYNYDDALYAFCNSLNERDGDYGEYYNHRGVAYGTRSGYMYGSWDHSGYHANTTPSILTAIATEAGPTWGPAHEIGHQHQALYTLNGEMEVTNNTFANVAVWYMGMGTSRINGTEGNLAHVYDNYRKGNFLLYNNIWALTHRYYRLWLYYHRVGNNTQFFPRLFELIRQKPMERSYADVSKDQSDVIDEKTGEKVSYQKTNGYRSYLHFYKLCCEAAQEDLTEFFRAYGCFTPVDGAFVGDYTNSKYYTTQKEIDKAIAEVKAKGYPKNDLPLFINDCTPDKTYSHDGKTQRSYWDGGNTQSGTNAEVGCYVDFLAKNPITGEFQYTLDDLNISITEKNAKGVVGYAIYNDKGEIQAFSSHKSFSLNDSVFAHVLIHKDAKVLAMAADGNHVEIPMATQEPISGNYEYTLSENKLSITGGTNAAVFALYNEEGFAKLFFTTSLQVDDATSRALALGELELRAYDSDRSPVEIPMKDLELGDDFTFSLNGNTITIANGANAFCYIVYDKDGKELAYSGKPTFTVSTEIINLLAAETSYIMAIGANGKSTKVEADLLSYFLASLEAARVYTKCGDETGTKVGMFIPDSLTSLAALVAAADLVKENEIKAEYYSSVMALDSAVNALLKNKGACIPLTPNCFYSFSTINDPGKSMGTVTAGLNYTDKTTDNVQWRIIAAEKKGTYYMQNRETGNYLSYVKNGLRVKAESSDINSAAIFTLVAEVPGEYYIQCIGNDTLNLYTAYVNGTARVMAGKVTTDYAKWNVRLVDNLLQKPEVATDSQMPLYYLQRTDNNRYAFHTTGLGKGRISSGEQPANLNYWFYFTQGNEEGKYAIYNYNTGMSLTLSGDKVYANKTTDKTVDYSIELNEEGDGLVIATEQGKWYIGGGNLAINSELSTTWKLQRICYATLALDKENVSMTTDETTTLTAQITPEAANGCPITWSSSDETIAKVDSKGKVTPVGEGNATITATAGSLKATCVVTVTNASNIDATTAGMTIQSRGAVLAIEGLAKGTQVRVYNTAGNLIASAVAANGAATIDTKLTKGNMVIIKVGTSSVKYSL